MRHMLGNLSPNYFERTKRYMMLRASQQGTDLTVSGTPPLSLTNSLGKPLKAWSVDLLPNQEGTGDPSPDNVRPIHGTDKINLYCGSPNVWDEEWVNANEDISETTGEIVPTSATKWYFRSKNYMPLHNGEPIYNYNMAITGNYRFFFYDANYNYISVTSRPVNNTVTPPSGAAYMLFRFASSEDTIYQHNISINYPATIRDYNPHQGGITSITLPQTVYTGTIGSEGGESRSEKIVLNGSENWVSASSNSFYISVHQMKKYTSYVDNRIRCESLSVVVNNNRLSDFSISGYADYDNTYPGQNWLYIKINGSITTPTELRAWLAQNPVTVVYELATPTTFAVSSVTIPTPTGTATTWATAEDGTVDSMEVTYVGKA